MWSHSQETLARQHDADRSKQDFQIVLHATILQVQEVESDLSADPSDVVVVPVQYLSQTRQSWLDSQPQQIIGDFLGDLFDEFRRSSNSSRVNQSAGGSSAKFA